MALKTCIAYFSLNSLSTTTSVTKSSSSSLPHIFLCPSLLNQTKFPLFKEYFEGSKNLINPCITKIDEKTINCTSFVKRTLIGFCIHISYNFTELKKYKINHLAVKHFYLRFHYHVIPNSNVKLFLIPSNEIKDTDDNDIILTGMKPALTTLLPNALTVIRINELFKVSKDKQKQTLNIGTYEKFVETNDYLTCIDKIYENEITKANCSERIFVSFKQKLNNEYTNVTFANSPCSLNAAKIAKIYCESLEADANFYLVDISTLSNYKLPKFLANHSTAGNVIITFRGMLKRTTLYTRKTEIWKLISDIGGTFSLYTGFTFLSILETIAFFSSSKLRQSATQDEQTLMERKNPPLKFPFPTKQLNKSAKILKQRASNVYKIFKKVESSDEKRLQTI
uniref:Uncharacterized protein n=1 Tax=Panagrolaimus sp. PS1159 TaxID=55785 RepID=A0AC35FIU7_9BILA